MAIARDELYENGQAFLIVQQPGAGGAARAYAQKPVKVLEIMRGAARVRREDGREITVKFSDLVADHEWLDERDKKEEDKKARVARESKLELVEAVPPRNAEPLKVSMADMIKQHQQKVEAMKAAPPATLAASSTPGIVPDRRAPAGADNSQLYKDVGARIALVREARGLSGSRTTARMQMRKPGLSPSTLHGWERGVSCPLGDYRTLLAWALGVDEAVLFDLSAELPELEDTCSLARMGKRLAALREARGLSITQAAQLTGIGRAGLTTYEKGERTRVDFTELETLAEFYHVTRWQLEGFEPMPSPAQQPKPKPNGVPMPPPAPVPAKAEEPEEDDVPLTTSAPLTINQRRALEQQRQQPVKPIEMPHVELPARAAPRAAPQQDELDLEFDFSFAPTPAQTSIAVAQPQTDMVNAWIEMGRRLREPLLTELRKINTRLRELKPEVEQLRTRHHELKAQLEGMNSLMGLRS